MIATFPGRMALMLINKVVAGLFFSVDEVVISEMLAHMDFNSYGGSPNQLTNGTLVAGFNVFHRFFTSLIGNLFVSGFVVCVLAAC